MMLLMMRKVIFFITQLYGIGIDVDHGGGTDNYYGDEKGDDLGDDSQ